MNPVRFWVRLGQPCRSQHPSITRLGIIALLIFSAMCLFLAPLAMPRGYSWLSHAISESAAQGLNDAWIARLGMFSFGLAVLWLALFRKQIWYVGVYGMQLAFAVFMLGASTFSHRPWIVGVPWDPREDFLHSVAATGMGFAFALGVALRFLQRGRGERIPKILDWIAILAAVVLTPLGGLFPAWAGLLQRLMFVVAYLWFIHETVFPCGRGRNPDCGEVL